MKTQIIAEAGVNHNGDLGIASELIKVAAGAGADYVKFQTFNSKKLTTVRAPKASYQVRDIQDQENQLEMLSSLELSQEDHFELKRISEDCGIKFLSTAFDLESLDFLISLGVEYIKIPSGEINNFPFLRYAGSQNREILLSTGASTLQEVGDAIEILQQYGTPKNSITVLHCTSSYPAPIQEVNLRSMEAIRREFGVAIGYSDHTEGISISLAAVALGARVIEKHFTLDRTMIGPDHKASITPTELNQLVSSIREVEGSLGDGLKRVMPSEKENQGAIRKSIVARRRIAAGEMFSEENLTTKRPGDGLSPMLWEGLIGTRTQRDYEEDEQIVVET
jgi:N-acetylneuraminate synthase